MYKHSACRSVITPSFPSSLSLSHSVHFLHMFHPSLPPLSPPPPSILCLRGHPQFKFACKVMKSHRHTPVPAEHTLPSFKSESHVHNFRTHTDARTHFCTYCTQTYFPINNACWPDCSQRGRQNERMTERRKNLQEDGAHCFTKLEICFKNQTLLQLKGE